MFKSKNVFKIGAIFFIVLLSLIIFYFLNAYRIKDNDKIFTIFCYDFNNHESAKNGLTIPCERDEDCSAEAIDKFCEPSKVLLSACAIKDFCGSDGTCQEYCD